ncbi:MAG: hypothetical protein KBG47_11640 [Bacteroidia bacterium]|nr:hypothetical protein [Bacteroidia bacterium]
MVCVLLTSCKKKTEDATSVLGLDYYPTKIGKFVVYDVDSTVYNDLSMDTITYKYRIKERLVENFTDNEGRQAIRLERSIKMYNPNKSYDSMAYTVKEAWMINANDKKVQVVESNLRYTKLTFPVLQNSTWDGNANNNLGQMMYAYSVIDKAETMNAIALRNVLTVKQRDDRSLIAVQYYTEKYAKGVGLVYREIKDIYSNTVIANIPVEQRIEKGLIYKQTLVSYGYE